jgi:hypothetical protein
MNVSINKSDKCQVRRFDKDGRTMVTLEIENSTVDFFLSTDAADILFPALQKVYENAENASQG